MVAYAPPLAAQEGPSAEPAPRADSADSPESSSRDRRAKRAERAFKRGAAHYAKGEYAEALVEFRLGHRLYPSAVFVYNIAMSHMRLGQPRKAGRQAAKALQFGAESLETRTLAKAAAVGAGSHVVLTARERAEGSGDPVVAAAAPAESRDVERQTDRSRLFGWMGWTGTAGVLVGAGGLVTTAILAADINRSRQRLHALSTSPDREGFERLQAQIGRKQRLGTAVGIAGSAVTLAGAGLIVAELLGAETPRRVAVGTTSSGGVSFAFTW